MVAMTISEHRARPGRPFTYADLETMPDDGYRREIVDGVLIVSPSPVRVHQTIVVQMTVRLVALVPRDLQVFTAPFDVVLAEDTVMEPDVLVARRADLTERNLPTAPVLAVEVLSPSTRLFDLHVKHERFQRGGCPSYWVIDPGTGTRGPTIRAWELRDGVYVQIAEATGEKEFRVELPFPVAFRPVDLLDLL